MLIQQTLEKLHKHRLFGIAQSVREQLEKPALQALSFEERLGMAVDEEDLYRDNRRRERLQKRARLKFKSAMPESIEYRPDRGLERSRLESLFSCEFIEYNQNIFITGPAGTGKTYLACAFCNQAMRKGIPTLQERVPLLMDALEIAQADGSLRKERAKLIKPPILFLDDLGISPPTKRGRQELLEVLVARPDNSSVIITSQLPVSAWHEWIGEGRLADAIMDRLVNNAHRIEIMGESERKRRARL